MLHTIRIKQLPTEAVSPTGLTAGSAVAFLGNDAWRNDRAPDDASPRRSSLKRTAVDDDDECIENFDELTKLRHLRVDKEVAGAPTSPNASGFLPELEYSDEESEDEESEDEESDSHDGELSEELPDSENELSLLEAGLLAAKQQVDSGIMSTDEYHSLGKYVAARQLTLAI